MLYITFHIKFLKPRGINFELLCEVGAQFLSSFSWATNYPTPFIGESISFPLAHNANFVMNQISEYT